jgi:uncharacterized protein DUF5906
MSDEDDIPTRANVPKLADHPAYKQTQSAHVAPPLTSKEDAIKWVDNVSAITSIAGKHMIIDQRLEDEMQLRTEKDFVSSWRHIKIWDTATEKSMPVSQLWLDWSQRRTYERGIIFDPKWLFDSKTMRSGAYNKWQDFAVQPIQGECPLMLEFINNIICSANEHHRHYTTGWISQVFQEPWNKLGTALVLRGLKGIGKSFLAKVLGWLMNGKPSQERRQKIFLTIDNKNSIFGNHNDHLENIIMLCLEEAIWAGDKAHESTLKHVLTGSTLFINPKNLPGREVTNYIRAIIIGNADWIVPATHDERRFFVLNVNNERKDDRPYFDALEDELLNRGGLEALMYYFKNYDYSDINLRTALVTEAQIEQKTASMFGVERWWFDILCSGKLPFVKNDEKGYWVIKEKLMIDYNNTQSRHKLNEREFGIQFKELIPLVVNGGIVKASNGRPKNIVGTEKYTSSNERLNVHVIPKLETCRQLFNMRIKTEYDYGSDSQEWEYPTFTERNIMSSYQPF